MFPTLVLFGSLLVLPHFLCSFSAKWPSSNLQCWQFIDASNSRQWQLRADEIFQIVKDFRLAARNAVEADNFYFFFFRELVDGMMSNHNPVTIPLLIMLSICLVGLYWVEIHGLQVGILYCHMVEPRMITIGENV